MWEDQSVDRLCPQKVQMLVVGDLLGDCVRGELLQHDIDIDQTIRPTIDQHNGCLDILSGKLGNLVVLGSVGDDWVRVIVVVHLERAVADDLEPMDHTLGRTVRVKMGICGELLLRQNVISGPSEKKSQGFVNHTDKNRRIQNRLPHSCRRKDGFATKRKVQDVRGGFYKGVDDSRCNTLGRHGWRQRNEDVNLFVERRVYG